MPQAVPEKAAARDGARGPGFAPAPRVSRRRLAAGMTLGGVSLGLVLCELLVRALPVAIDSFPAIYQAHPVRRFELRPLGRGRSYRGVTYAINAEGFRDAPYARAKSPAYRVLVLGDSVTMGYGVPQDATYPKALERMLRSGGAGSSYDVMNGGVNGYNTAQEVSLLMDKGLAFAPDLVVVGVLSNDFAGEPTPFHVVNGALVDPSSSGLPQWLKQGLRHSALYWFLGQLRTGRLAGREPDGVRGVRDDGAFEQGWMAYREHLERLVAVTRARGAALLVCYIPGRAELVTGRASEPFRSVVAGFLRDQRVPWVDLFGAWRAAGTAPSRLFLPTDPVHLTPQGHARVAEALLPHMRASAADTSRQP